MTSTSGTPLTVGCLLTKSTLLGPDCDLSPHPGREVPLNVSIPYIDMLLGPQKPAQGQPKQSPEQKELNALPSPEEVMVTLRLTVDSCGPSDVSALIQILLGGTPISCRNHHLWIQAVRDYFDDVPLCVPNCQLLRFVCVAAPQHGCKVCLVTLDGCPSVADLDGLAQGSVPFPEGGVHVHIRPAATEVSGTAGEGPQLVTIDCTGLGGHDLGGFKDYDICLRTDKHSQSIYGPSVTPMESPGQDGVHQVTLVALGGSKAMQEFLVLHYLATDSAREWDVFLDSCLPECTWVRAGPRRALALHMYDKCHIAPSHRRFAHPSWIAGIKLMLDLLLGARKHRYLGRCLAAPRPAEVYVRGFSAGSYSGICLLHLLWNMPHVQVGGILGGISCPPALIHGISPEHGQRIMLIHLTTDRLCQWHPDDKTLHSLNCKYCIVDRKTQELKELFGSCEHSYGHWIDISLPHGRYPLYRLLRRFSDVAPPQARDIAPLRLVSWVSCEVPDHVQQVLNQLMVLFGAVAPVSSDEVLMIRSFLLLKNMLDNYFFLPARCLIVSSRSTACKRHGRRLFLPAPLLPILPCYPNAHTALGEVGADGSLSGIFLLPNLATDKPLSGNSLATLTELASVPALAGANTALSPWSALKMILFVLGLIVICRISPCDPCHTAAFAFKAPLLVGA